MRFAFNSGETTTGPAASRTSWLIPVSLVGTSLLILGTLSLAVYTGSTTLRPTSHTASRSIGSYRLPVRSIAARARDVVVPADLDDPKRIASGGAQYDEMCSGCHLAPGMKRTEISQGLYPRAPELRRGSSLSPAEEFWVVKHGIKATGMAAWGVTHDDELLWDVVAFLRKLPAPDQYQALVKSAPKTHNEMQEMETRAGGDQSHQ
jgi:mono/diheme cytochrome c family protein